jgi:hypothetical protein
MVYSVTEVWLLDGTGKLLQLVVLFCITEWYGLDVVMWNLGSMLKLLRCMVDTKILCDALVRVSSVSRPRLLSTWTVSVLCVSCSSPCLLHLTCVSVPHRIEVNFFLELIKQ